MSNEKRTCLECAYIGKDSRCDWCVNKSGFKHIRMSAEPMQKCHTIMPEQRPVYPELMNWDEYFLNLSANVALKSKDKSSKIGAVIVGPGHEIRSTGYNGFPRGMNDNDTSKQERPLKYKYFEHAERNAIYNAARFGATIDGCIMYCQWPPCSDCARAIIQAGIVKLVVNRGILTCPDRWHEDMIIAAAMLRECGVRFEVCDEKQL